MEQDNTIIKPWQEADQHLFDQLYPAFRAFSERPTYSLLVKEKSALSQEKDHFFRALEKGEIYLPDLTPSFDAMALDKYETDLLDVRSKIKDFQPATEDEHVVKDAYRWRVNAIIGDLRIAQAASNGDMRRFNAYNEYIYGRPSKEVFESEVATIFNDAWRLAREPSVSNTAQEVMELFQQVPNKEFEEVSHGLFEKVKAARQDYLETAMAGIELPDEIDAKTGMLAAKKILENVGATKEPFNNKLVRTESGTASYNQALGELRYPVNVVYTRPRFIGLFAGHEVGDHIMTLINGASSGMKLLEIGMDRQEMAAEGRGTISEQVAYDSLAEFQSTKRARQITMRHLAVSLAKGLDGQPRNFHEVYKITEPIFRMYELSDGAKPSEAQEKSKNMTWNLLTKRALKGTRGTGAAYQKDMVYAEGNYAYWRLAADQQESIPHWYQGKFDMNNPRHIAVLQKLGVLPKFTDPGEAQL